MNWIKGKKQRIVIGISVALLLCGFPLILLSQKFDGYPHNVWSSLGILMGMAGSGGIGAVISLNILSKRSQRKCCMNQKSPVNRLYKKAWKDFWAICVITIMGLLGFGFLSYANIKGVLGARFLLTSLLYVGFSFGCMFYAKSDKTLNIIPYFDEREFYLIQRAIHWGNSCFVAYVTLAMVIAFYLVGGRGMVPMWSIPLVLFCGFFLAGTVQFFVLMHHAKQDDKEIEGGAA